MPVYVPTLERGNGKNGAGHADIDEARTANAGAEFSPTRYRYDSNTPAFMQKRPGG